MMRKDTQYSEFLDATIQGIKDHVVLTISTNRANAVGCVFVVICSRVYPVMSLTVFLSNHFCYLWGHYVTCRVILIFVG
jgi:hypothetical protein